MMKSMTAYGRASKETSFGKLTVEVQSVNRKVLDINIYLPKDLFRFDVEMRKWLSSEIERGQVTVRVVVQSTGGEGPLFEAQVAQLKMLKRTWDHVARELGTSTERIDLPFLIEQLPSGSSVISADEEVVVERALKEVLGAALIEFKAMKEREGEALGRDIVQRLQGIEEAIERVQARKEVPLARFGQKIKERLQEVSLLTPELEEKVAREVAVMAEKMDVTEEVVRLYSHLKQTRDRLSSQDRSVGRTLDFLVQEMNREINTLASKSADTEISTLVVKMKGELEKIREQVQNIE